MHVCKSFLISALVFTPAQSALAAEPSGPAGAKSLFSQGGAGIAYSLEVYRRGESQITTVSHRHDEFRTGDRVRMRLKPNFAGFTYVLQADQGKVSLVYPPILGSAENQIEAGSECYVPAQGWLRLVEPARPFTMLVLVTSSEVDYSLDQQNPNPDTALGRLTEAVNQKWQAVAAGSKGIMFEPDTDQANYTTNYVVVSRNRPPAQPKITGPSLEDPTIAIEVPIRHVFE